MKNYISLILTATVILFCNISYAQHFSNNTGFWHNNSTWVHEAPPYNFNNNITVKINYNHEVTSNEGISFNNNMAIDIDGDLIVNGDIKGKNNFLLNVSSSGTLIINGNIDVHNNTIINLDGVMEVDNIYGFNENTNFLIGNGDLYLSGEIDGFNTDYFNGTIIDGSLPIELLSFSAELEEEYVNINWITASEINNDFFTIEKSRDANHWEAIANINGAGNSNQALEYNYKDYDITDGIWYYRLKQTDFDGQYKYFSPVAVEIFPANKLDIIKAHNNENHLLVSLKTAGKNATLIICDMSGNILHTENVNDANHCQTVALTLNQTSPGNLLIFNLFDNNERKSMKYMLK